MSSVNQIRIGSISTSEVEIRDILKAWISVSIAFGIILSTSVSDFYSKFIIASLTVGIGFLFHELGHKIVAQRYGCFAEFRSFDRMLILALVLSFITGGGLIFAAPGAVMISGYITKKRNGKISAAGPLINLVLALFFLLILLAPIKNTLKIMAFFGFAINSWLALFNMMPFWHFDGYKILKWNKLAYGSIAAIAFVFVLLQNLIPFGK